MTEKLIHSLPPTTALPPFVTFEDCKKGETAAKTGCTPASGEGSKKPTDAEIDEFEKDLDRRKEEMDKGGSGEGPKSDSYEKRIAKIVDEALTEGDPGEAPAAPSNLPEELAGFSGAEEMFEEQGWDMEEAEITSKTSNGGLEISVGGEEWLAFPNAQAAEKHAVETVARDIQESPEMYEELVRRHVSFSPTDVRVHAGDLANSDLEAAVERGEIDEDDQDAVDSYVSERHEEHEKGLAKDPREYLVDELEFGDDKWFFNAYPGAIDADDAAQALVNEEGVGEHLSMYDSEEVEAGETRWYRYS